MAIDPRSQFILLFGAPLAGFLLGALWELIGALRILLGAYSVPRQMRVRYERPLPLLKRPVPIREVALRRIWRATLIAVGDCLFCLFFAALLILLLYRYNDGQVRFSVPVLALFGFGIFRITLSRLLAPAVAYFAYLLAALRLYLLACLRLPLKGLWHLTKAAIIHPVLALVRIIRRRLCLKRSESLCHAQLVLAENGLVPQEKKGRQSRPKLKKGEKRHGNRKNKNQSNAPAMGDPHSHYCDLRRCARHRRRQIDGVEPGSPKA